jgi:hypothetical protein
MSDVLTSVPGDVVQRLPPEIPAFRKANGAESQALDQGAEFGE